MYGVKPSGEHACPLSYWGRQFAKRSNYTRDPWEFWDFTPEKQGIWIAMMQADIEQEVEQQRRYDEMKYK